MKLLRVFSQDNKGYIIFFKTLVSMAKILRMDDNAITEFISKNLPKRG